MQNARRLLGFVALALGKRALFNMNFLPLDSIDDALKRLNLSQLEDLHDKVALHIRAHRELERLIARSVFRVGDKVSFIYEGLSYIGTLSKKNPKTILVHTDHHRTWKISPHLLSKITHAV